MEEKDQMRRRQILKKGMRLAGFMAMPYVFGCAKKNTNQLTILNWPHYGTDEQWAIDQFKERTGITITHEYYSSEADMMSKLRTHPSRYDIIQINSAWNKLAVEQGLIQSIDTERLRWFKELSPVFRDSDRLVYDSQHFGVAWVWGITSLAYNKEVLSAQPETIQVMWDKSFKKRIFIRDDAIENIGMAAIATGQDMNHPQDLNMVKEKLLALKPQLAGIWDSEQEWNEAFAAGKFDLSFFWSGGAARSITKSRLPVGFNVAQEGAIGWFDGLSISHKTANLDGALKYIDYLLDPEFYAMWATKVGAPASVNPKGMELLPEGDPVRAFHTNNNWISRLQFMARLSDREREVYEKLWIQVKSKLQG